MRRFQHFKTLFCRSLLYQTCKFVTLEENIWQKRVFWFLRRSFFVRFCHIFSPRITKELSLCHKLWFSYPYIFATQCLRPHVFQNKYTVRSNNLSLKYQRFTPSGSKDMGIKKFKFVTKNQFLCMFDKKQTSPEYNFKSFYPSHIVVKLFESLKFLKFL